MIRTLTSGLARRRASLGTKDKGFTLIELLVVVLILGVLSAVAIPIFLNQQEGAKDSAVQAALTNAKSSISLAIVNGSTPTLAIAALNDIEKGTANTLLDGYAKSDKIFLVGTVPATGPKFSISGSYGSGSAASSTNVFVITDTTTAKKPVAP